MDVAGGAAPTQVPEWSGEFWESDDGFGYLSVHVADERTYRPPGDDWRFVRAYASFEDDSHMFVYRKVCTGTECPCGAHLADTA